jgi:hypothetical protein
MRISPNREVVGFAVAPIVGLLVNGLERRWLGGNVLSAFHPLMIVFAYVDSVLFGLPLYDYLIRRGTNGWIYVIGGGLVAGLPILLFTPVFWVYAIYPAFLAIPCGAAWGATLWIVAVYDWSSTHPMVSVECGRGDHGSCEENISHERNGSPTIV